MEIIYYYCWKQVIEEQQITRFIFFSFLLVLSHIHTLNDSRKMLLIRCRAAQQTISQTTCQTTVDVAMQKLRSLKLTSCMRSSFLTGANSVVLTLFEWIAARLSQCMSHASKARARGQCKVLVEKTRRNRLSIIPPWRS